MIIKNKGMFLEEILEWTIRYYENKNIALLHKKNLDFKIIKKINKNIFKCSIYKKSTIDYYGIYKNKFIVFEAKETEKEYFSIYNIKEHQINYLKKINNMGGIGFFVLYFHKFNLFFKIKPDYIKNKMDINYLKEKGTIIKLSYPLKLEIFK